MVMLQKMGLFLWIGCCFLDKILNIIKTSFRTSMHGCDGERDFTGDAEGVQF